MSEPILKVENLKKYYDIRGGLLQRVVGHVKAVDGISFEVARGSTFGLVGESGCGKTTVGKTLLRLHSNNGGQVIFDGKDVFALTDQQLREIRPEIQIIFQDPYSSLSPKMPVGEIIGEAVREHKIVPEKALRSYVMEIMRECGLQDHQIDRYPHEFSGGQRQRICIARAVALKPKLIVCDEPVSALDVSVQAQIINLLMDLQKTKGLSYVFISHDLSVVEHISNEVGVMYLGNLVEKASTKEIFQNPMHPYTKSLFSAIPTPDPTVKMSRIILEGDIPSPANPPAGCKFHTRCRQCMEKCKTVMPEYKKHDNDHYVACHLYD
ncbi:ABC transporter ATP-binding protein [Candidatus Epulonipiscium viviparus]|uniref:ABC transporter ATP-binding protein n=1 Tax=Candidatus Epulonipiscium viviparus TaxID=420336 RepID=UPI00016C0862|nr:oligopeptide/dipeptide ABC transporter ATP-binding protein [Candidatus Epulopiscium viviparus]